MGIGWPAPGNSANGSPSLRSLCGLRPGGRRNALFLNLFVVVEKIAQAVCGAEVEWDRGDDYPRTEQECCPDI
jgi:hypothetical protein